MECHYQHLRHFINLRLYDIVRVSTRKITTLSVERSFTPYEMPNGKHNTRYDDEDEHRRMNFIIYFDWKVPWTKKSAYFGATTENAREKHENHIGMKKKERKTFLLSLQPNNENSVVSELKLSSTSSSYRAEKKEKLKRRLWVQTRGKNCGGARENVEQSESKYRLEWEWKSRGGEDVLFKFSSLFPLLLNAAAACIYLRLNKQKLLRFVIVLITLAFAILPDCAVVHMLEKQIAMRWEYTVLLLNY